jgi:hypothetical protein
VDGSFLIGNVRCVILELLVCFELLGIYDVYLLFCMWLRSVFLLSRDCVVLLQKYNITLVFLVPSKLIHMICDVFCEVLDV